MIDPFTALAAIQTAVKLVKTAAKTVQDVESLGPVLSKFFSAKADGIKVLQQSKTKGFKGSAMGQAIELELAIEQARAFEEEVKMLFFQSNKMDVWQKIKARATVMEAEAAKAAGKAKEDARRKKQKDQEELETAIAVIISVAIFCGLMWGGWELFSFCRKNGC